jgi:saccharopine dehydrogenase (NAD+, L-lysine-forming)
LSKITVLGGCGAIGSWATRTVAKEGFFDRVVIAEKRYDAACTLAEEIDPGKVSAVEVDADDVDTIKRAIEGSSVVLNCIGPYYRYGPPILEAVIESGIDYADVCDDLDATQQMLAMDGDAKKAGISALIGMGNSPGLANVLAKYCAETMLSQVDSVDIFHIHGGEHGEGGAVIKHRIHAMISDIPLFVDGKFIQVRMLEESGMLFAEDVDFRDVGTYRVYPYPHPETITLPKYMKGIKHVTNKGSVLPTNYFDFTMDTVRLGLASEEPIPVQGQPVVPIEFEVAFILSRRQKLLDEAGVKGPRGCLKVVVKGTKDTKPETYVFSMSSTGAGAGEGTGIPGGIGAILIGKRSITLKGVFPPEAAVNPVEMIEIAGRIVKGTGVGESVPIHIEHIDAEGRSEEVEFAF